MSSLRERSPRVWQLRVPTGTDPIDGRRLEETETFHGSKRAANERLKELEAEVARKAGADSRKQTLGQAITAWRANTKHAKGTADNYDRAQKQIPAKFLSTPLNKVTAAHVRTLLARYPTVGQQRTVHAVVSGGLTYAWRQEWIFDNVARRVPFAPVTKRTDTSPTAEEVRNVLTLVEADPELHAWILLSSLIGGRPSETLALRWSHIDFTRPQIRIAGALEPRHKINDPTDKKVKGAKAHSERTVSIGPRTADVVARWRAAFEERADELDLATPEDPFVFAGDLAGTRPWRTDVAGKRWARLRKRAGVRPCVRLYDFRHFHATEMMMAGVPDKQGAGRTGHRRTQTYSEVYGHVRQAEDMAAAVATEARLLGER